MNQGRVCVVFILLLLGVLSAKERDSVNTSKFRQEFIERNFTFETAHFRVHYEENLERHAREVATILENLYEIYRNKYAITLPTKTEVLVADGAISNGWALAVQNTIGIWVHDFDWNLRGNPNWLENVVAHEYAHIVSISASFKFPSWMPYIQAGAFSHSNKPVRGEALYILPSEVLPPWFFEGIAQYESEVQDGDSWDAHREMILRQLALNDNLLTWDQMSVFNGRFDNYEKTYNHGYSLVRYMAEKYGYDKIIAILRESKKFGRFVFDRSIKNILGISGRELYAEWAQHLKESYVEQLNGLGDTTEGQIINQNGYNNFWPKFSSDEKKIYYLSNGERDNPRFYLYSYNMLDTVPDSMAFRLENPFVNGFYSLHPDSQKVLYSSVGVPEAFVENFRWQDNLWDLYTYKIFPDTVKPKFKKRYRERLTEMENRNNAVYSPDGNMIVSVHQDRDRAYLEITSDHGKSWKRLYPNYRNDTLAIHSIYSVDWAPNGKMIALGYLDRDNRKVGFLEVETNKFYTVTNDSFDSRDPRFSSDSKRLYFASDREDHIFNIYRYDFDKSIIEKVTNTVGGAFTPDVNDDETRLLYSSYTANGYAIYLADSFSVLNSEPAEIQLREGYEPRKDLVGGIPSRYNPAPRKVLAIPTVISEEVLTDYNNPLEGIRHTKFGAIVQLVDPMAWRDSRGNTLTFFFLTQSYFKQLADIVEDKSNAKKYATDFGVFGMTEMFPFDLQLSYFFRNIPTISPVAHDRYGYSAFDTTNYSIQPSMFDLQLSYPVGPINVNYYFSYFNYKVQVDLGTVNSIYLNYDPSKNVRNGVVLSHSSTEYTQNYNISPHRFVAKVQYEYNDAKYIDPDEALLFEDGKIKENYDFFKYHVFKGAVKKARSSFLNPKIDFEWGVHGSYLMESDRNDKSIEFPGLYVPSLQVPGYAYFYQSDYNEYAVNPDPSDIYTFDTVEVANDSVVASGKAIVGAHASYRFPLFPGVIDKKLGFIYLDKLYGAVNGGGVLTANSGSEIMDNLRDRNWDDWLFFVGAEVRLSTIAFNSYPLAMKFRWDQGLSRKDAISLAGHDDSSYRNQTVGGARFTFALGFEFDNWTIVEEPDGLEGRFRPYHMR